MKYKKFFKLERHSHMRHDPPGSEDADVNNDGKVDKNDKYIMAKRRLYKQYQAVKNTKKATDFSTPKLENNMIKLSGLVNLKTLREETKKSLVSAPTTGEKPGSDKRVNVEMKLKKLKEMQMTPDQEKKVDEMLAQYEELTAGQKKLDVDKDGEIEGSDLAALRKKDEVVLENEDHEVSMGNNALDDIIKNATELKEKLGMQEKDVPAWIQDHISQAQNFIAQANTNFHDYDEPKNVPHPETDKPVDQDLDAMKETVNEAAPTGWEKTVLAMKKHKEIDNPWALAHWMKKKGYHPQNESVVAEESIEETGMIKKVAYIAKAAKDVWKQRGREKDAEKQANVAPRIGKSGKETPASARDRATGRRAADMARKRINRRVKGIDTARGFKGSGAKVKNPETGKEILATTAAKNPDHPAHSAAKSALSKK